MFLNSAHPSKRLAYMFIPLLRVLSLRSSAVHLCTSGEYQSMGKPRKQPKWKNLSLELFRGYFFQPTEL